MIISDRFEVGYLGGESKKTGSRYEALIIASELLRQLNPPGLAVVDHNAPLGQTNLWAVVDGKLKGISRKE